MVRRLWLIGSGIAVAIALAGGAVGLSSASATPRASGLRVVAAENFWGSIASQLGGTRVQVTSVISNPAADPHDYEPTAPDARTLAGAQMVIVNGIGYDPWADNLLAANPVHGRLVLNVGDLVGIKPGGNPHRWYSPPNVQQVIAAISRDYTTLDPKNTKYFTAQKASFETRGLARYTRLIATIKRKYHGTPVGASESIFQPLAQALGLRLLTPTSFLNATSEGTEPSLADRNTINKQIGTRQIKVWVYNSQNSTPDIAQLTNNAKKKGIAIVTITETLTPETATFQDWQTRQLQAVAAALAKAGGH